MAEKTYWLDLFTGTTWDEFVAAGCKVSGFPESRWKTVQRMKPGDLMLCYVTRVSRFIGVLEVTSKAYKDTSVIWKDDVFPCRLNVKPVMLLTPETAVPVKDVAPKLTFATGFLSNAWTGHFRGSPTSWKGADGDAVVLAIQEAKQSGLKHPINPALWGRSPKTFKGKTGPVTIPGSDPEPPEQTAIVKPVAASAVEPLLEPEATAHTEVQWHLLKLGADMGFSVWVAKNDKGKIYSGKKLGELPKMRPSLPLQFDEATNRTIELIDVLWLRDNAIVAAFEVESTTSIYSGLLRMSDLLSMQPNLNIPLYLVAPDARRDKVLEEVNRPTFSRLKPPMAQVCRFIAFNALRQRLQEVASFVQYLKPEFLMELSEDCKLPEV